MPAFPAPLRWVLWLSLALLAVVLVPTCATVVAVTWNARSGSSFATADPTPARRSAAVLEAERVRQGGERALVGRTDAPQVLFGDLHVHTSFSADAAVQQMTVREREGVHPPAHACDFARFCSALDFWSINDHAESLTPAHWRETVDAIRRCNELAGDPESPDMVSFLGWEWSQAGLTPEKHYGHKNVLLLGTSDEEIPARPIGSGGAVTVLFGMMGVVGSIADRARFGDWADFQRYFLDVLDVEDCPDGVPVRDLPADCRESTATAAGLFAKLDEWALPALVIPHGLAWGTTNPPHADLASQLREHDPRWQRLIEVYSGHGNSELYADFRPPEPDADGELVCPEPGGVVEHCCQRAAVLARERCAQPTGAACDEEVAAAVRRAAASDLGRGPPVWAVAGTRIEEWGECGQLAGSFLPAWSYRPRGSAQYALALGSAEGEATDARLRLGLMAASDIHRGRPGTGFKEFGRQAMTDGVPYPGLSGLMDERAASLYYTGGLAAVHARGRDRDAIFQALERREVYGTSGDRILLWFDLLHPDGSRRPMGSELALDSTPRFEVRAVGSAEQLPGCPEHARTGLSPERLTSLCRDECYNPGDRRRRIERVEVVRIRPQSSADEPLRPLIEDPWQVLPCAPGTAGCSVTFEDPDFTAAGRETLYYVRAIQEPTPAVNGDPLRCERDASGRCVRARPCGLLPDGTPDDCLAPVEERAWSSPIFLDAAN